MRIRRLLMHAVLAADITGGKQAQAKPSKDGEWPMAARDHAKARFSPLDNIKTTAATRQAAAIWGRR